MSTGTVIWSDQSHRTINVGGSSPVTTDILTLPPDIFPSTGPVLVVAYATMDSGRTNQPGAGASSMTWSLRDVNGAFHQFTFGNPGPGDNLLHVSDAGSTFIFGGGGFVAFVPAAPTLNSFDPSLFTGATLQVAAKANGSTVNANLIACAALIDNVGLNMSIARPINSQINGSSGTFSTVPPLNRTENDFIIYGSGLTSFVIDGAPTASTPDWTGNPNWINIQRGTFGIGWAGIGMLTTVDTPTAGYSFSTSSVAGGLGQYVVDTFTSDPAGSGHSFGIVIG